MKKLQIFKGGGKSLLMLLLLSVAGIGKTFAYDFYAIIDNQIWGAFNYVDQEQHTVEVAKGLNEANVTIPSTVTYNNVEYTVVGIGEKAFYVSGNKSKLVSVTIPNTVTYIAKEGFYYCRKLTSIEIPASVTSIGELAFHLCDQLTSITFATPSSLASIGEKAFSNCHVLAAVTIPSSVTSISELPFSLASVFLQSPWTLATLCMIRATTAMPSSKRRPIPWLSAARTALSLPPCPPSAQVRLRDAPPLLPSPFPIQWFPSETGRFIIATTLKTTLG